MLSGSVVDPVGFNEAPDPAFYLNSDPDPGSQTNVDPGGSGSTTLISGREAEHN